MVSIRNLGGWLIGWLTLLTGYCIGASAAWLASVMKLGPGWSVLALLQWSRLHAKSCACSKAGVVSARVCVT